MSENGDCLAGDTGSRYGNCQLPIHHTTHFNSLTNIDRDLHEALESLRERDHDPDSDPTDFRPLIPAAL